MAVVVGDSKPGEFSRASTRCRTEIGHDLGTIAGWFRRSDATAVPDFRMDLLVETAVEVVKNCFPRIMFAPSVDIPASYQVKGVFFYAFVDVLFILLDNAVRHSGSATPKVHLRAHVAGGRVEFAVTNVLSGEAIARLTPARIDEIQLLARGSAGRNDTIRAEGGSGFVKLRKLLSYDLRRGARASLGVRVLDGGVFQVTIGMPVEGLFA